jgi:hypothetical protein
MSAEGLFRKTMLEEFLSAWRALRQAHPNEHFYSFGFYTTELAEYLMVTASTEEGLSLVTERYLAKKGGDPRATRAALRWSPCDSPLHAEGATLLSKSEMIRKAGPEPYDETQEAEDAVSLVFDVAIEALKQLDHEGAFGSDLERARIVLGIWKGDQSDEERVEFARRLNPKSVVERFAKELADGNEAFFRPEAT